MWKQFCSIVLAVLVLTLTVPVHTIRAKSETGTSVPFSTMNTQNSTHHVLYNSSEEAKGGIPVPFVYEDQLIGPIYPQFNVNDRSA